MPTAPTANLQPHHERTIARLVERYANDPAFPAMLVGGSLAKGLGRPDSDVDVMLVATPEEYRRRVKTGEITLYTTELCDYPGGYVDGKIVDMAFLEEVADHGSEPARWAFTGAWPAYSRIDGIEAVLARIAAYPDHERDAKVRAFFTQFVVSNWYVGEAERHSNFYLLTHFASNLLLFGGRLILAHNRLLYPYHKWFMHVLSQAPDKPTGLMEFADALLKHPGASTATAYYDAIYSFRDWGVTDSQAYRLFTQEYEWAWRTGTAPIADL